MDESVAEQGQGEGFTTVLLPERPGVEIVTLHCGNLGFELHVVGITVSGTP